MSGAVLDTNILVSALLGSPSAKKLLTALDQNRFTLILSDSLLQELLVVARRPKFKPYITSADLRELVSFLRPRTKFVRDIPAPTACRDPKDDVVLACALAGRADVIVTGDQDLLSLHPFRGISILTPQQFLSHLS